jgi:hypothetical protein
MVMPCVTDRFTCCTPGGAKGTCELYDFEYQETAQAASIVVDDDGDPVDLSAVASGGCLSAGAVPQPCTGAACDPVLTLCAVRSVCGGWYPGGELAMSASDGVGSVAGSVVVAGICVP